MVQLEIFYIIYIHIMEKFDKKYLKMARIWATNSHAIRNKVGALLVKDNMIISDGYNGTPKGFDNCCEYEVKCDYDWDQDFGLMGTSDICNNFFAGNISAAHKGQLELFDFIRLMFRETNPTPIKYAMSLYGLSTPEVRLPLLTPEKETKAAIEEELRRLGADS